MPSRSRLREDAEEREVGFGGGLVEPLHAVRPGAVVDDVGQMGVQGEGEKTSGNVLCLRHQANLNMWETRRLGVRCRWGVAPASGCWYPEREQRELLLSLDSD